MGRVADGQLWMEHIDVVFGTARRSECCTHCTMVRRESVPEEELNSRHCLPLKVTIEC